MFILESDIIDFYHDFEFICIYTCMFIQGNTENTMCFFNVVNILILFHRVF